MVNKLYISNKTIKLIKITAMNISYYDFKNLTDQAQCNMVVNNGRVMNERTIDTLKYVLYELSCFTVEIAYNTANNKIAVMNVFQNKAVYAV